MQTGLVGNLEKFLTWWTCGQFYLYASFYPPSPSNLTAVKNQCVEFAYFLSWYIANFQMKILTTA